MSPQPSSTYLVAFLIFGKRERKKYIHLFSDRNAHIIKEGLESLLRVEGRPVYLTIEDLKTGKILQFAGSSQDKLYMNLPAKDFSESDVRRAMSVLNPYKISFEDEPLYLDEEGRNMGDSLRTFSKNLGDNIDLALEICSKVFFDIYRADDDIRLRVSMS